MKVRFTIDIPEERANNRVIHDLIEKTLRHCADVSAQSDGFAGARFPLELEIRDDDPVNVSIEVL